MRIRNSHFELYPNKTIGGFEMSFPFKNLVFEGGGVKSIAFGRYKGTLIA